LAVKLLLTIAEITGMVGATTINMAGDINSVLIVTLSVIIVRPIVPIGGEIITGLPTGPVTVGAITTLLPDGVGGKPLIS
jgi:hypothetical protein